MNINELERVLMDQIEKLNDDSIASDAEECRAIIDRSSAISSLTSNFINIQRLKLDTAKFVEDSGGMYEKYLGIEGNVIK